MAVYKRKDSPFYFVSFTDRNGCRVRRSTEKRTLAEAELAASKIRLDAQKSIPSGVWTFEQATGTYWTHHAKHKRSAKNILYQLDNLESGMGGPLDKISNTIISEYVASRRASVSDSSVNRELTLLRAVLRWAHKKFDQPLANIDWRVHHLQEPPPRDRYLTSEEYEMLLASAHSAIRPIIVLAVNTGLRKSNILNLYWSQVDMKSRRIRVVLKGNKRHSVRMNDDALLAIANIEGREGRVFETTNFRRRWERALGDSKIEQFRFHDLRHTFASWLLLGGARLIEVCLALGHSDITMTQRYAHLEQTRAESVFDLIMSQSVSQSGSKSLKSNKEA